MVRIALSGYVTMDFVARVDAPFLVEGTNRVEVSEGGWPRAGGGPLFAGKALAAAGHNAMPIAFLGDDPAGRTIAEEILENGLPLDGVVTLQGARTPTCFLLHQPSGKYCCFFDQGTSKVHRLADRQSDLVGNAHWIVVMAGPAELTNEILDSLAPDQKLAWIVKADASSFPDQLRNRLRQRASVIFCNRQERDFWASSGTAPLRAGQIIFETDGERGVHITADGRTFVTPTAKVAVHDATGAGDTFAGGALSVLVDDQTAIESAARHGLALATRLLEERISGMVERQPVVISD